jgi:hypothetical protein
MKRIKSINGYSIYQAVTARDEESHRCQIGNYNIYFSSDIRDYGLSYSDPNWEDIDSLEIAIELCDDNYAIAKEIAESTSTCVSFEEIEQIERNLGAQNIFDADVCYDDDIVYPDDDDIIDIEEGYSIHFTQDGRTIFQTREPDGELMSIEIDNYTGMKIVWDVYGEGYVYDDGSEIEFVSESYQKEVC